jgi:prepilin-type N-terminal cleavage/methylation domain-containing protein
MTNKSIKQRGYSLIELVCVIALTTIMLNVSIALLFSVTTWDSQRDRRSLQAAEYHRLESSLRYELAEATRVVATAEMLTIETPHLRSEWQLAGAYCLKTTTYNDERMHDRFSIGPAKEWQLKTQPAALTLELVDRGERQGISLRIVVNKKDSEGES